MSDAKRAKAMVSKTFQYKGREYIVLAVEQVRGSKKTNKEGGYWECVVMLRSEAQTEWCKLHFKEACKIKYTSVVKAEMVEKLIRQLGGNVDGGDSGSDSGSGSDSDERGGMFLRRGATTVRRYSHCCIK